MKRTLCDGCYRAGLVNDLTGRQDIWRVRVDQAHVLELCPERCAPIFEKFDAELRTLRHRKREEVNRSVKELTDKFWKEVENAIQIANTVSGTEQVTAAR